MANTDYRAPIYVLVAEHLLSGKSIREIANLLGVSQSKLRAIVKAPQFQRLKALMAAKECIGSEVGNDDMKQSLSDLVPAAIWTLRSLLDDALFVPHSVRLEAAKTILDRAGYPAHQRIESQRPTHVSDNFLALIRNFSQNIIVNYPKDRFEHVVEITEGNKDDP